MSGTMDISRREFLFGAAFDLPADFKSDANADVFKIVR